jgi:hypothetical protein
MDRLPDCTTIKETVKMGYIYIYKKKREIFLDMAMQIRNISTCKCTISNRD